MRADTKKQELDELENTMNNITGFEAHIVQHLRCPYPPTIRPALKMELPKDSEERDVTCNCLSLCDFMFNPKRCQGRNKEQIVKELRITCFWRA